MLVLKRQKGEVVVIGDNVFCRVLSITGDQVCLGFEAPATLAINCEEVHEQNLLERLGIGLTEDPIYLDKSTLSKLRAQSKNRNQDI